MSDSQVPSSLNDEVAIQELSRSREEPRWPFGYDENDARGLRGLSQTSWGRPWPTACETLSPRDIRSSDSTVMQTRKELVRVIDRLPQGIGLDPVTASRQKRQIQRDQTLKIEPQT